ncbi:hypothetical protein BGX38DRAFT_1140495 [Terfezia claveryi]|nr:hypothetical protein BGX38DRAFT_1140495 [Terfezia claveryi]
MFTTTTEKLMNQFNQIVKARKIITFNNDNQKYYWCNMRDCGLEALVFLRLSREIVMEWEILGITDIQNFETNLHQTPEDVEVMVRRQVDSNLRILLGITSA